jgi:hypothetical protein
MFGAEPIEAFSRAVAYVRIWPAEHVDPGLQLGAATVVPIEVVDADGNMIGIISTCFPADRCGSSAEDSPGDCVQLPDGSNECLVETSSGMGHVVHVLDGPVTVAEVAAGLDLAELRAG